MEQKQKLKTNKNEVDDNEDGEDNKQLKIDKDLYF